jgi:adapter protein MecA 1/2
MEIKRIDESTIKIVLTEEELQERGIKQDEIWRNRDKGETLFVDMMEEAYQKERFEADGPLWIEAHMHDYGVEIFVTKGNTNRIKLSEAGSSEQPALGLNDKGGDHSKMNHDMFSSQLQNPSVAADRKTQSQHAVYHSSVYKFKDIENVIQLAHRLPLPFFDSQLYSFDNYYYLVVKYPESRLMKGKDWVESLILEYGERGHTSIHRLDEYGNSILADNAIATIKIYFQEFV